MYRNDLNFVYVLFVILKFGFKKLNKFGVCFFVRQYFQYFIISYLKMEITVIIFYFYYLNK